MKLVGASASLKVIGQDELPGKSNYLLGNDPKKWLTNVPIYSKVRYKDVYPGIDLVYYGNESHLEYDFLVSPHADPNRITLSFAGAQRVEVDEEGDLQVVLGREHLTLQKPLLYQASGNQKIPIDGKFQVMRDRTVAFHIGDYDRDKQLTIDPIIVFSSYLGGSGDDLGYALTADPAGFVYVTGNARSQDFPVTGQQKQIDSDVFVTKIDPSTSTIVYSTIIGGSSTDYGYGVAVDQSGSIYLTGGTYSTDFPVASCFQCQNPRGGGYLTAFVSKLGPNGSSLLYSTYLGGTHSYDFASGITVDATGHACVAGYSQPVPGYSSSDFPVLHAIQPKYAGGDTDGFVTKLSQDGSSLMWSTFLGGSGTELVNGISSDISGNIYVAGTTTSTDFPLKNPFQSSHGGTFVSKIASDGSSLQYSTLLGGSSRDSVNGIAVNGQGEAYVTGYASSTDFPLKNPYQATCQGPECAFLTKFTSVGNSLMFSTLLGGSGGDSGSAVIVDQSGSAYLTGQTSSIDFPTVSGFQFGDLFVAEFDATGSVLDFSTRFGGSPTPAGADNVRGIAIDGAGNVYVAGYTSATDFPTTLGTFQNHNASVAPATLDAFVVKLSRAATNLQLTPYQVNFGNVNVGKVSNPLTITITNPGAQSIAVKSLSVATSVFSETDTCSGTTLAPGATCSATLSFSPMVFGQKYGTIVVYDSAGDVVGLGDASGIGVGAYGVVSPTSLVFPQRQFLGTTSSPQLVRMTNIGNGPMTLSVSTSGDFAIQDNRCLKGVKPNTHCDVYVVFSPSEVGTRSGSLVFSFNGSNSPIAVSLSGVGITNGNSTTNLCTANVLYSQPVSLCAQVTSDDAGKQPSGSVTFFVDSANAGTATLIGSQAQLQIPSPDAGTYVLQGQYNGDSNFQPSSGTGSFVVYIAPTSVTLTSAPNPAYVDQSVVFTATTQELYRGTEGGSVTFKRASKILGTVPLVNGQASLTTAFSRAASFAVAAFYSGDQNHESSKSNSVKQVVQKYSTSTALTSSLNPSNYGQAVTLTATVTSTGPTPTGTVAFKNGTTLLGSAHLINGVAKITTTTLPRGTDSITGTYSGDSASTSSTSPVLLQVVN
jgi:hypothetical protein